MKSKKQRILLIGGAILLILIAVVLILWLGGISSWGKSGSMDWTYSYAWNGNVCTATRVSGTTQETEIMEGVLTVQSPATMDKDGSGYYTVRFKNPDFNANYNLGRQPVVIPAGSGFTYGKAGLNTYLFDSPASKYYYAQVNIEATTQSGWVGFVHSANETFSEDGTYFYDTVSYKAGKNYEHGFGSVIDGNDIFENKELADAYEGPTKKGLTGVDFSLDGMTLTTLRHDDLIYLFINGKRVATYMIDRDLALSDTLVGLYFNNNSTFYSGTLSNIQVVEGQAETEAKLTELLADSESFVYSNIQNWNKNEGLHTGAVFDKDFFTYKYDDTLDLSNIDQDLEGYTHDRRYMTGVTDRVFLSGNYYYQYEISGPIEGFNDAEKKGYGLFFNYINSAMRSGIYYRQEAMWCFKENDGLERVHFDAGKGVNGDGVSGWVGGTAFGGSDNLKSEAAWQAAYKNGLIVRITRASYVEGEQAVYAISVTAKSNPDLVFVSKPIVVDDEDKGDLYGGYDWIMFATQSVDCTVSNVTFGRVEGEVEFGHDPDWRYSYSWKGTQCRATRVCRICGERETETAQGYLLSATVPTKETAGKATYKAVFKNDDYNKNAWKICKSYSVELEANAPFSGAVSSKKYFGFEGTEASKNYYVEMKLSAPTAFGYVGLGHVSDEKNYFYDMFCNGNEDGNYYHRFASAIDGNETVYGEIAEFIEGTSLKGLTGVDFSKDGMTLAVMRMDGMIHTFLNGTRIATYMVESELAALDTVPVVFMENFAGGSYDGQITDVVIIDDLAGVQAKYAELVTGSAFSYVGTPNWRHSSTDATFHANGFTYTYDANNAASDRRFVTGVNDRVFLAGNYYYQYEISGDMAYVNAENTYGLFYNWINTRKRTESGFYKHEANFGLKLAEDGKLQRLTFDKGQWANGDGATGGWSGNTTAYGGKTDLANDSAWQAAIKQGLIVRIERTAKDSTTDVYVISVTAKSDPTLKLVSTPIEVSDTTFGGYNWILFGTQSVNCTVSNVTYGRLYHYSSEGTEVKAPTCGEPGIMRYYCVDAGFEHLYIEEEIPATGDHSEPTYTYTWSENLCTAARSCPVCGKTETETVRGQIVAAVPATKDAAGKATYNAVFQDSDFNENADAICTGHEVELPANTPFMIADDSKQHYAFDGITAGKNYYIEMNLSAATSAGYVGVAHWGDSDHHFYDVVSYSSTENYTHAFSSVINGSGKAYSEPAKFYEGTTQKGLTGADLGADGMTFATLRLGNEIHTFINGKRIATYLIENELAAINTVPVLYFDGNNGYYDGSIKDIVIITDASAASDKLAELTTGSDFGYANTPNWNKGIHTDATFNSNGFTYAYNANVSTGDRRFVTGVHDRVFLAEAYYYQYEISGDMSFANGTNVHGLFYNWINTKSLTQYGNYKHEATFCLKLNGDKLQRLTFDKGSGANGDGSSGWVSNTTAYGGNNTLESDAVWQEAYKDGLIVRIERTVKNSTTDVYVISVTAKSDPTLKIVSTPIEVSDATFGGYNWILFGTQSVNCTVSNVTYGRLYHYSSEGTEVKAPTCSAPGIMRYPCTDPGFTHLYKDVAIPATGVHTWNCTYVWEPTTPTTDGVASCTGTAVCSGCGDTQTETVSATFQVIRDTDGLTDGEAVYTATFTKEYFTQQTFTIAIPKEEHVHNWTYTYGGTDSQCTATRTCVPCGATESETVEGQFVKIYPATKDAAGKTVYTCVFQNSYFNENFTEHAVQIPANTPFSITEGGKQTYDFDGISASKYYYIEVKLSAPTSQGYVGIAHWADSENYFADTVSYVQSGNYNHAFSSTVGGVFRSSIEPAKYFEGDSLAGLTGANFGSTGMTVAALRMGDVIHTFINGKRVATYLIEEELAALNTVPALYFNDNNGYYDGAINDIVIVTGASAASAKLTELTSGSDFGYANTPNWNKGVHTDATFNSSGFTYAYDSGVSYNDRRFVTGVNDRVFLAGDYYYQYEISGDMTFANGTNVYGLFYNWINTKTPTSLGNYKHEATFCLKLNGDKLQRLTFDKGSGANGDGSSGWVSNTTAYGGNNTLESDAAWQEAYKGGLIVRIERTVKNSTTDVYVITVTAKSDPTLKITSTPIEVSDATYGGYNWILFGTQSVNCTISNVSYGHLGN